MIVNSSEILNYIPQRAPFIMVGEIGDVTEKHVETQFLIEDKNILLEGNCLSVSGLLENIAQSAAAQAGFASVKQGDSPPLGFIGAISKVKVNKLPLVGSIIDTSIDVLQEVFGITLISGEVRHNGELLISCQLKIMIDKSDNK